MTDREENKLSMYQTVLKFMDKNAAKLDVIPAMAMLREKLRTAVGVIHKRNAEHRNAAKGATNAKATAEEHLADEATALAGMCATYASVQGDDRLEARTTITMSDLRDMRDTELSNWSRSLYDVITEHQADLVEYGLTEGMASDFLNLLDVYDNARDGRDEATAEQVAARQGLTAAFRIVDHILYKQIDRLMERFRTTDPKLYNGYQAARVIKDIR